jgi:hypothetical protein
MTGRVSLMSGLAEWHERHIQAAYSSGSQDGYIAAFASLESAGAIGFRSPTGSKSPTLPRSRTTGLSVTGSPGAGILSGIRRRVHLSRNAAKKLFVE